MTRRRRSGTPSLVIISWRDIPAQVTATGSGTDAKAMMPPRFQRAIDRAAKVAGKTDHRSYIGEWRRRTVPLHGDAAEMVTAMVDELNAAHDRAGLETLVRQGGLATLESTDPSGAAPTNPTLTVVPTSDRQDAPEEAPGTTGVADEPGGTA